VKNKTKINKGNRIGLQGNPSRNGKQAGAGEKKRKKKKPVTEWAKS
jgi:hypothetical protein